MGRNRMRLGWDKRANRLRLRLPILLMKMWGSSVGGGDSSQQGNREQGMPVPPIDDQAGAGLIEPIAKARVGAGQDERGAADVLHPNRLSADTGGRTFVEIDFLRLGVGS